MTDVGHGTAQHSVRADSRAKSVRQIAAEVQARMLAEARARTGACQRDLYRGFNARMGCDLPAGHAGPCR